MVRKFELVGGFSMKTRERNKILAEFERWLSQQNNSEEVKEVALRTAKRIVEKTLQAGKKKSRINSAGQMIISEIKMQNIGGVNFEGEFERGLNVIGGCIGNGKTTVLESPSLLLSGRSNAKGCSILDLVRSDSNIKISFSDFAIEKKWFPEKVQWDGLGISSKECGRRVRDHFGKNLADSFVFCDFLSTFERIGGGILSTSLFLGLKKMISDLELSIHKIEARKDEYLEKRNSLRRRLNLLNRQDRNVEGLKSELEEIEKVLQFIQGGRTELAHDLEQCLAQSQKISGIALKISHEISTKDRLDSEIENIDVPLAFLAGKSNDEIDVKIVRLKRELERLRTDVEQKEGELTKWQNKLEKISDQKEEISVTLLRIRGDKEVLHQTCEKPSCPFVAEIWKRVEKEGVLKEKEAQLQSHIERIERQLCRIERTGLEQQREQCTFLSEEIHRLTTVLRKRKLYFRSKFFYASRVKEVEKSIQELKRNREKLPDSETLQKKIRSLRTRVTEINAEIGKLRAREEEIEKALLKAEKYSEEISELTQAIQICRKKIDHFLFQREIRLLICNGFSMQGIGLKFFRNELDFLYSLVSGEIQGIIPGKSLSLEIGSEGKITGVLKKDRDSFCFDLLSSMEQRAILTVLEIGLLLYRKRRGTLDLDFCFLDEPITGMGDLVDPIEGALRLLDPYFEQIFITRRSRPK
jgi:hypothetical protein